MCGDSAKTVKIVYSKFINLIKSKPIRAGYWGNLYIAIYCNIPNEYCDIYCNIFIRIFHETKTPFSQALRHFFYWTAKFKQDCYITLFTSSVFFFFISSFS